MKFLPFLLSFLVPSTALFAEEAGKLDFLISTTGHGPSMRTVSALGNDSVFTSDSSSTETRKSSSCYIASRSIADGKLQWRRNVCSQHLVQRHAVAVGTDWVATVDAGGAVRTWSAATGSLLWEKQVKGGDENSRLAVGVLTDEENKQYVVATASGSSVVFDAETGNEATVSGADKAFQKYSPSLEAKCEDIAFKVEEGKVVALNGDSRVASTESLASSSDTLASLTLLSCSGATASLFVSTTRGSTTLLKFNSNEFTTAWKTEEGLAQVSSAVVLDASHYVGDLDNESQAEQLLSLNYRLQSQWSAVSSFFTSTSTTANRRDHFFGFVKVAALVSSSAHRLYGIYTTGDDQRGSIRYAIDLPVDATWHRLVHGAPNAAQATHGINGATHSREILVLSATPSNTLHWSCLDGSNGAVHDQGTISLSAAVVQVIPTVLHTTSSLTSSCRQGAWLVLNDQTVVPVVEQADGQAKPPTGLFTHMVEPQAIQSLRVGASTASAVGTAAFPGEEIVSVAYPSREEVIQSPCTVLGDDSLLLKYLNPHMAVVLTRRTVQNNDWTATIQSAAAGKNIKATPKQRKPQGVEGAAPAETDDNTIPNLFVSVVDTVSGRVLYRTSHAHAADAPTPTALISENWVVYTYLNQKTRRAQVGVLSLYEGMIGNKGVTAFTSPEQTTSFSSLDARDSKPVVLAKVYSMAQPATAMGMTTSRGGISSRRLIVATLDGQIRAVDRKVLDPRRPVGQVKESEKKEGLRQYSELIPLVTYMSLSYNQTVEGVTSIVSAPTDLESQSLVLAFGGPDIFFVRTSPSKGFDLLPDSFNRSMLSVVVAGLLVVLVVVQGMAKKKIQKQGWV